MVWYWVDWLVLGIAIIVTGFLLFLFKDERKKVLLRVEEDEQGNVREFYRTVKDEKGVDVFYYHNKKKLFQRLTIIFVGLEFIKDYIITRGAEPFKMLQGERHVLGIWLIAVGYPILVLLVSNYLYAFMMFRVRGTPVMLLKFESKPVDAFGDLLPPELVKRLSEKAKGHRKISFYVFYDKEGMMRLATRNVIKMINDTADYLFLNVKFSDMPVITDELIDEYEEEVILLPVKSIKRTVISETEFSEGKDAYVYDVTVWEYEGERIIEMFVEALQNKTIEKKTFMEKLKLAYVFERLHKEYDKNKATLSQLRASVSLAADYQVAEKLEEDEIQLALITESIDFEDITEEKEREEALKEAARMKKEKQKKMIRGDVLTE